MSYNSIKPSRILIVEDSLIDRKQSGRLLSKSTLPSFEIKHTEYPENALTLLNANDFDTATADLNLPDGSGLDTAGQTELLISMAGLPLIEIGVSTVVAVLEVARVLGALVCRNDAASCTHKPDLRVMDLAMPCGTAAQEVLLQQHILPDDTITGQAIR